MNKIILELTEEQYNKICSLIGMMGPEWRKKNIDLYDVMTNATETKQ